MMLRYYNWGHEKRGYVSVWIWNVKSEVIRLGQIKEEDLPVGAIKECPYN